ncbi:MAG: helix-turn-helix domain-containing protein [Galbitalea sp.]
MTDQLARASAGTVETGWEAIDDAECRRVSGALELIGRKWSSGILLAVARGTDRFSQIRARVIGLSDRLLAARLTELEHAGLIDRIVEATTPVTIRYQLTPRGHDLMASLNGLVEYGQRWSERGRR